MPEQRVVEDTATILVRKENERLKEEYETMKAEVHNLQCQVRILQKKVHDLDYANKLKMQEIVKYRRLIEHYEDGAPNYVATHG